MSHNSATANWGYAIAYHPLLARFFGSTNAAIFFQQISYWSDKTKNPLGVYKSSDDLTMETGLSYREQLTVRKLLVSGGYMIETNKRLEHRIYFLIDWHRFNTEFLAWRSDQIPSDCIAESGDFVSSPNAQSAFRESMQAQFGECAKRSSGSAQNAVRYTKTTTETTTETTANKNTAPRSRSSGVVQKPDDVSDDVWESFKTLRKAKKAPITDVVVSGIRREAKTAGITLEAALSTCCERGWAGFRADWIAPSINAVTNPAGVVMNRQEALEARNMEVGLRWVERMEREAAERGEL